MSVQQPLRSPPCSTEYSRRVDSPMDKAAEFLRSLNLNGETGADIPAGNSYFPFSDACCVSNNVSDISSTTNISSNISSNSSSTTTNTRSVNTPNTPNTPNTANTTTTASSSATPTPMTSLKSILPFKKKKHRPPELDLSHENKFTELRPPSSAMSSLEHKRSADSLLKKFRSPSLPSNVLHPTPVVELPSFVKPITCTELRDLLLYYKEETSSSIIRKSIPISAPSTATITPIHSRSHSPLSQSPDMNNNSATTNIHLPSPPNRRFDLDNDTPDDVFIIDTRPCSYFNSSRILHATSICVPSTLLKRPNFTIARFAECMAPEQRLKLAKLSSYSHVIVYDQSSSDLNSNASTALNYMLLKLSKANEITGRICYLQGGISEMEEKYPQLIETTDYSSKSNLSFNNKSQNPFDNGPPTASSIVSMPILSIAGNLLPASLHKTAATTTASNHISLPPVLTGFSLPAECKELGASKSGFMSLDNYSYIDDSISITLPRSLTNKLVNSTFPEWLIPITHPSSGSVLVARKFNDIEEIEKSRLRAVFSRDRAFSTPTMRDTEGNVQFSISTGLKYSYKNRYNNIWPYDHSRVVLSSNPSYDYINACHISSEWSTKRYIATQAPLPDTVVDFWTMVYDEKVPVIVMLTAEYEGGQVKCHPYWENGKQGDLELQITEQLVIPLGINGKNTVTIRKFQLTKKNLSRHVVQIHYKDWPDLGAPASAEDLLALCELKEQFLIEWRIANQSNEEPNTLVHCSAGCGRTGTFCTVDTVVDVMSNQKYHPQLNKSNEDYRSSNEDIIYKVVNDFRCQRKAMVQSLRQYSLCYESAILWCFQESGR